jgi:transposase InsO family protein
VPEIVDADVLQSGMGADEARTLLGRYIAFYNSRRPHSSLDRQPLLAAA